MKVTKTLKAADLKGTGKNTEVEEYQKLITDKFKAVKKVTDSSIYKRFAKYGADGKFGGATSGLNMCLKAGFGLKDTSGDITQELIDKIETEKLQESLNLKVLSWDQFESVSEAFNADSFLETEKNKGFRSGTVVKAKEKAGTKITMTEEELDKKIADSVAKVKTEMMDTQARKDMFTSLKAIDPSIQEVQGQPYCAMNNNYRFYSSPIKATDGKMYNVQRKATGNLANIDIAAKKIKDSNGKEFTISAPYYCQTNQHKWGSYLYTYASNISLDINNAGVRNKALYTGMLNLKPEVVKKIASAYKDMYGGNLHSDLRDEWTSTKEIQDVLEKFGKANLTP